MTDPYEPKVVYDFDPRNLPEDMLRAIGLVVAASAQTESVIQDLIGALLPPIDNIQTRCVTTHMSAPLKDHVARALAELLAPSIAELDEIDELLDRVNDAYEKRNLIVHNSLAIHPETGEILSFRERARGSLVLALQPVTAKEFEKDAIAIYEAGMNVMRFMMSRGIGPTVRTKPLRAAVDRRSKARAKRRES